MSNDILLTALQELIDVVDGCARDEYVPDLFTAQPARNAIRKARSDSSTIYVDLAPYTVPLAVAEEVEFLRGELARSLALDGELRDKLDRLWGESAPHEMEATIRWRAEKH